MLAQRSPTGKVPVLIDGELVVPETIAIIEYLADIYPGQADLAGGSAAAGAGAGGERGDAFELLRAAQPRADEFARLPSRARSASIPSARDLHRLETLLGGLLARIGRAVSVRGVLGGGCDVRAGGDADQDI